MRFRIASCTAVVAIALAVAAAMSPRSPAQHRLLPDAVPPAARPLPLSAVRLTGGPLKRAQDITAEYLLTLEPDRMLAFYRQRAGLEPRAKPYGGWDGDGRNLTGHIAGHYLSAVSLMWAATGDARFKARADDIVSELKTVQAKHGDGFAGALAGVKEAFAEVKKGDIRSANFDLNGLWSPWYTLHKTFAGLRDAYRHTGNRSALDVEVGFAEWAERQVGPLGDDEMQRVLGTEFGGMNEVLADLYADTGDARWLALSRRFEHRAVLDPLKRREDPLQGLHGNTQVPKVLGSLARYEHTGDREDLIAASYFWERVARHHSFATGGHGKDEYFREPDTLGTIVDGRTAETCNVYNMLKLTRALFAVRPDVQYAEFHERALFNHILGSLDPGSGAMCYMVPVGRGVRREYQDMQRDFTCCVGSGMESHALHGAGLYYESGDRLWVNLYVPSTAEWKEAGVRLRVETDFPEGERATIALDAASPRSFTLALRRPSWAGEGFAVTVNGEPVREVPPAGSYVEIARTWRAGDEIAVRLPKALRLERTPDQARLAAILWGPLVLAGDLGPDAERDGEDVEWSPRRDAPVLIASDRSVGEFVKPVPGRPGVFRTDGVGRPRDVELVPFYRLHRRVYSAYWDLIAPGEYEKRVSEAAAERERLEKLDAATIVSHQPGDKEQELAANQLGEGTSLLRVEGRRGRRATKWFSYDLPLTGSRRAVALTVTYNTDQRRRRTFDILVDGVRVASEELPESSVSRFVDVEHPVAAELLRGKTKVTIRFEAAASSEVPAVFAIRLVATSAGSTPQAAASARGKDYPVRPVPFTDVQLDDEFWAPRIETNRVQSIPFAFQQCERTGRVENFVRAAKVLRGEPLENRDPPGYPFDDSDLFKVIEGASYALSVHPDPTLDAYVDSIIGKVAAAQEPDGYLYTTRTIDPQNPHRWAGKARWELERDDSHELYNLGHLYEAAVAHYQATGKRTLLNVAIRSANLLVQTFGPGKRSIWPGHQVTEMGLARLYRVTGDERYLALSKFLLDERGPRAGEKTNPRGLTYNQAHSPVVEQTEAVGHAVRATYMYSGMADVAALTGDRSYLKAVDAIWSNVVGRKLYITGGIGATGRGEAFGGDYELPNMTAYNETCAAVGNDLWNHRLFLLHGDAKYIDVMERTLYNGLVSGVSLDGKLFFYPNPLESNGQHERSPWFGVACCPGNITRFLASLPGYVYARQADTIFVNLFVKSTGKVSLEAGPEVKLTQDTRYPWDGRVRVEIDPGVASTFALKIRIPGWARNEPVPSDLYRFADAASQPAEIRVNGELVDMMLDKGYVALRREWKSGDTVELLLPMPVRRIAANEKVEADRGRLALQRGPIVFAAEWPDNPGGRVRNLVVSPSSPLTSEFRPDLLNGVQIVKGRAVGLRENASGKVEKSEQAFVAIPYASWANRGRGEMIVWLAAEENAARPAPFPTLATSATMTTSPSRRRPYGINDGEDPRSSSEPGSSFDWWPRKGALEWIEMRFGKPTKVSDVQIYWFDDTGDGEVRVPASWRVLYSDGGSWKPVDAHDAYGLAKDQYNQVRFTAIVTSALRVEIQAQEEFSAGVQEVKVK